MNIVEAETRQLLNELETVRKAKHDVEEARARGAEQRDMHGSNNWPLARIYALIATLSQI